MQMRGKSGGTSKRSKANRVTRPPITGRTNWARLDAMTEEDIQRQMEEDPDHFSSFDVGESETRNLLALHEPAHREIDLVGFNPG
jgi:hypothetical protein